MGDLKSYLPSGGFDQYLYTQVGDTITASNGVQGKVIMEITRTPDKPFHESLPIYSNTSEAYLKLSDKGTHEIEQARVYRNRQAALDLDWGHTHGSFKAGTVHVHEWCQNGTGRWIRSPHPRYMNNYELARYGNLIKRANPKVKLRP